MSSKEFNFEPIQKAIEENAQYIDDIVDSIVLAYAKELDDYVSYMRDIIRDVKNPITDAELDDCIITLPTLLYYANSAVETLGIREDIATTYRKTKYNEALSIATGTIPVKAAAAELAVQDETLTQLVYSRASRKLKAKTEMAQELLQSAKKILSRRMNDFTIGGR